MTHTKTSTSRSYTVHFFPDEKGGFTVEVPALPGCVTEGDTFEQANANIEEAIQVYVESLQERGIAIPDDRHTVVRQVAVMA